MAIEVKVPLLPESITDATVSTWHKKAGDKKCQPGYYATEIQV